jgi:crotonobetainyl-CoA:carnitine CoA-transferase CaiB-like acyl-CoA transferase
MLLSDLGADVVLVEQPGKGDPARGFPGFHGALARGKRSVVLDLKSEHGRLAFAAILRNSDVLMDGFRPGTLERLGFGEQELRAECPRLVYVTITGYGRGNSLAGRPGHDINYEAEAGVLGPELMRGEPPSPPPIELADLVSGLFAVQAVLLGLVERGQTSAGPTLDVSMFDALVSLLSAHLVPVVNDLGPAHVPTEPGYGLFRTADNRYIALGVAFEDHFWSALCDATGMASERHLPSSSRFAEKPRLQRKLAERLLTRTAGEWEALFGASNIPFGIVRSLAEVPDLPIAKERELFVMITDADGTERRYVRQPLVVNGNALGPRGGVPRLGEHTAEVLRECGVDEASIDAVLRG